MYKEMYVIQSGSFSAKRRKSDFLYLDVFQGLMSSRFFRTNSKAIARLIDDSPMQVLYSTNRTEIGCSMRQPGPAGDETMQKAYCCCYFSKIAISGTRRFSKRHVAALPLHYVTRSAIANRKF